MVQSKRFEGRAAWVAGALAAAVVAGAGARPAAAATPGVVVQHGEVVIMVGDDEIVGGTVGARELGDANAVALLDRFYQHYPDEFDMVVVWFTWLDNLNGGAYYTSGVPTPSIRSIGFVNMNQVGVFGSNVVPVIGQEFSHAWLAYASFVDPMTGQISDELLGRQGAHWSQLMDADASVQDGVDWEDNGDGTFTVVDYMSHYCMLDLWYMGFVAQEEVPPFFILRNAIRADNGQQMTKLSVPNIGDTVTAQKVPITIEDIVAADGVQPPIDGRQKDFRLAFVLVTDIGESASSAAGTAEEMDRIRLQWNQSAEEWFLGRGSMCTDTLAPCNVPHARIEAGTFREGDPSDGDGVIEPGEHAIAEVTFRNSGVGVATGVTASIAPSDPVYPTPADIEVDDIEPGEEAVGRFDVEVPEGATCGAGEVFHVTAHLGTRVWTGDVTLIPGVLEGGVEQFATDAGWRGNADGADTAMSGGWEWGVAEKTEYDGRVLQPNGGAGGADDPAWWTGREAGVDWKANDVDTGITTLTSAPFDLSNLYRPALRYKVWFNATSINTGQPLPTDGDDLVVEASADGGQTWVEVDRVTGEPRAWQKREASLDNVSGGDAVLVRFTARDQGPEQNLVEVGIDDVQLASLSGSCSGGGGGGCRVGEGGAQGTPRDGRGDGGPGAAVVGLALGLLVAQRRRRRAPVVARDRRACAGAARRRRARRGRRPRAACH